MTGSGAEITVVWLMVAAYLVLGALALAIEWRRVKR